jgi:hypothetical protein
MTRSNQAWYQSRNFRWVLSLCHNSIDQRNTEIRMFLAKGVALLSRGAVIR